MASAEALSVEVYEPKTEMRFDFGNVVYERDLIGLLQQKGWRVLENRRIKETRYRGRYHLIVAEPADAG